MPCSVAPSHGALSARRRPAGSPGPSCKRQSGARTSMDNRRSRSNTCRFSLSWSSSSTRSSTGIHVLVFVGTQHRRSSPCRSCGEQSLLWSSEWYATHKRPIFWTLSTSNTRCPLLMRPTTCAPSCGCSLAFDVATQVHTWLCRCGKNKFSFAAHILPIKPRLLWL